MTRPVVQSRYRRARALCWAVTTAGWLFAGMAEAVEPPDPTRWEQDIAAFNKTDESSPAPQEGILFVGSSSIRMWDLPKHFPDLPVINRGFGGSHLADSVHYLDPLVLRHRPRVVVLYAGDNDIQHGLSADQVVAAYRQFVAKIHAALPETHIVYLPIKPSLARWEKFATMSEANRAIRDIAAADPRQSYVDLTTPMLNAEGTPRSDLFLEDGLHLNERGYRIWSHHLRPILQRHFSPGRES